MEHFFFLILKAILVQSMSKPFSKERYVYLALSTNYTRTCRVSFGRHGKLSKATNEDFTSKCWAKYIRPISTAQMVGVKAMDRHLLGCDTIGNVVHFFYTHEFVYFYYYFLYSFAYTSQILWGIAKFGGKKLVIIHFGLQLMCLIIYYSLPLWNLI